MDRVKTLLLEKKNVFIYKIPSEIIQNPKLYNRASNWDLSHPMKTCKLKLSGVGSSCHIQLDTDDGNIFGHSDIHCYPGGNGRSSSLNGVVDSSRYFTLTVENKGKNFTIGLGFSGHKDSSDLTKALKNYFKTENLIREGPTKLQFKTSLEQNPTKSTNLHSIKAERNYESETRANAVSSNSEKPTHSLNIKHEQVNAKDGDLGTPEFKPQNFRIPKIKKSKSESHRIQPEASEPSTSRSNKIWEDNELEQDLKERKEFSKFEKQLAEKCNIGVTKAEKLNRQILQLVEMRRKEKVKKIESDPAQDTTFGGFRYRLAERVFQCHLCPTNLPSIPGLPMPLISHWKEAHESKVFYCIPCGLVYSNAAQCTSHKKLVHDYSCFVCNAALRKMKNVRFHLLQHHRSTLLELVAEQKSTETCPVVNASTTVGNNHYKVDGDPKTADETDPEETKDTNEMERKLGPLLDTLIQRHRTKKVEQYQSQDKSCTGFCYALPENGLQCHLCPARFLRSSPDSTVLLTRHWRKEHGARAWNCVKCDLIFSTDAEVAQHKKVFHHADCCFCLASFRQERILRWHLFKEHKQELLAAEAAENNTVKTGAIANIIKSSNEDLLDGVMEASDCETDPDEKSFEKRKEERKRGQKRRAETEDDGVFEVKESVCKVSK